jgi:thiamine biosynthesis lipoprotein
MMMNRRGMVLALGSLALCSGAGPQPVNISRSGTAFGTIVRMTITASGSAAGNACLDEAFAAIRSVERACSLFSPDSELSQLNRLGRLDPISYLLQDILDKCHDYWRASDGAFDPSVQPLWHLWTACSKEGRPPGKNQLADAAARVGWRNLERNADGAVFAKPGCALTLNGIAQGYAADLVAGVLRRHGITDALIDTGETAVLQPEGRTPLSIGIVHPRRPGSCLGYLDAGPGFLATSGDYATRFSAGFRDHHIFSPMTGRSPEELSAVTVAAYSGAEADALATALMVMGRERGLGFLAERPSAECLMVDKAGAIHLSGGMAARFRLAPSASLIEVSAMPKS